MTRSNLEEIGILNCATKTTKNMKTLGTTTLQLLDALQVGRQTCYEEALERILSIVVLRQKALVGRDHSANLLTAMTL